MADDEEARGIGPILVKQLAEANVLDQNLFSFYMVREEQQLSQ